MGKPRARRRGPKIETRRMLAIIACAAHLKDLKRAHRQPPPDVEVAPSAGLRRLAPTPPHSYCTSPAQLCADIAK
jgi:hypothetical protein